MIKKSILMFFLPLRIQEKLQLLSVRMRVGEGGAILFVSYNKIFNPDFLVLEFVIINNEEYSSYYVTIKAVLLELKRGHLSTLTLK